jgi:pyruvate dehydrogenase E2 component (dihydrolipoamide acetyltransferase)
MAEFRMPSLGADMETGTVLEWLVAPGDRVHRGDVVAVVDTDKAAIDVECFDSGVISRLLVQPGEKVSVGTPLAVIDAPVPVPAGAGAPASTEPPLPPPEPPFPPEPPLPSEPPFPPEPPTPEPPGPLPPPEPPLPGPGSPAAHPSPLTRKRAAEAGVDLAALHGTGPGGLVTRADVERVARPAGPRNGEGPPPRPRLSPYARRLAVERGLEPASLRGTGPDGVVRARDLPAGPPEPGSALRRATAALMARSKREIPHYYLGLDIDMGPALERLRAHNRAVPVAARVLPAALLLRGVVMAVGAVPELNGHWMGDRFVPGDGIHLGVAVALRDGGLVVPVIRDADQLGLDELMARVREAGERARTGRLRSSEAGGATITVTNLGEQGVDRVDGVIHPPQVALVGFGAVRRRPWADGDAVLVRPVVTATLAADHRASDGATGGRLLREINRRLQRPEEL